MIKIERVGFPFFPFFNNYGIGLLFLTLTLLPYCVSCLILKSGLHIQIGFKWSNRILRRYGLNEVFAILQFPFFFLGFCHTYLGTLLLR
jgi:hypothetical protein